jgi:DNA-directed RNA polymerase specialized sigma subunit
VPNYINNKDFEKLIKKYTNNPGAHEEELIKTFDTLIDNIFESFGFTMEKDDAKQECFLLILKTLKNFSPDRGSAFNYFTTVIVNNLKMLYSKNKKYLEKIEIYTQRTQGNYRPKKL